MNIVFLTTSDAIYLPAFFDRVLSDYASQTQAVHVAPPLYKGQSFLHAFLRYSRTFGMRGVWGLTVRIAHAKARRASIRAVCGRHGVKCSVIADVNSPEFVSHLREIGTDLIVSVSCPQIFKQALLETPSLGCLNIHGALLPQYRGVMPSFWMLANGERVAGVSIYFMNEQVDAGELCRQRAFAIGAHETLDAFLRRSKAIAGELLLEVLGEIEAGEVERTPMDLAAGSYYSWPDRQAARRFYSTGRRLW
ncbi:MAG: formyltransferase family protein [Gaiellaceae bacterium]